jgi:hypothetical protein
MHLFTCKKSLVSLLIRISFLIALAIIISIFCTIYVRWQDKKIQTWTKELNIDLSQTNVYTVQLSPVVTRMHLFRIDLSGPAISNYDDPYDYIKSENVEKTLPGGDFSLSWKIESNGKILADGSVTPSNFDGYTYVDRTEYACNKEILKLKSRNQYLFTINIDKANTSLKEFKSTLKVYTWIPKGRSLYGFRLTLFLSIVFLVGLIVQDYVKTKLGKNIIKSQCVSSGSHADVNKRQN